MLLLGLSFFLGLAFEDFFAHAGATMQSATALGFLAVAGLVIAFVMVRFI